MTDAPSVSVVVPVYGCVACLRELCRRVSEAMATVTSRFEIVLVDDRSPDDSWSTIRQLQDSHPQVRGVRLSRNFGQHVAITAGLTAARGDYVVVMDCDLQDPPEKIPDMFAALRAGGHDLVLARRIERNHSPFRVFASRVYFKLLSRLAEERIDGSYGTFSLLSRKVVDAFLQFSERERHYLFVLRWLGFSTGTIEYAHEERAAGRSSYSFGRLLRHALNGMFFQATVLLRWIVLSGLCIALGGFALALYFIWRYFAIGTVEGWTSVVVLILMCTGVLLACIGVVGLYIGKIFEQVKARPLFVIDTLEGRSAW
jgi:glycosyltransferase involved in cell wall biosynthesis